MADGAACTGAQGERCPDDVDVLVVGGGINGAGIARDLAGRGLSVLLAEKDDLAQHTSSASTKLIHGGLRYLEQLEFSLVRKALAEREVLLRSAPHIMHALRFVMPHDPAMRPAWMIRTGLFLYDHLARRKVLGPSCAVDLSVHPAGAPLKPGFLRGFEYADGWVDDARLVVLNAMDAAQRGATILTRWCCMEARRGHAHWQVRLRQEPSGDERVLRARALVNAAGPWAAQFLAEHAHLPARALRLVKGSHIVVRKLFDHPYAYIFQSPDRRIIFAIPYEGDFTLVGTTDVEYRGAVDGVHIDADETTYLCQQASRYFACPMRPQDVVWSYSGVRPLLDDAAGNPSAVTRDYELELDTQQAPLLSVWGGKITTFRKLAEEAGDWLGPALGAQRGAWTRDACLPGGDLRQWIGPLQRPDADIARYAGVLAQRHPELPAALCRRYVRDYGSRAEMLLAHGLGVAVVPGLHESELDYLHRHEWARTSADVLWRRTKLGLHLTPDEREKVGRWCARHWGADAAAGSSGEPTHHMKARIAHNG
jgi:glycerol-3-phosphate dehydrogenase